MSETKGFLRVWGVGVVILLLFGTALALTGCVEPPTIAAVEPTATTYAPPPTHIPPPPPGPTPSSLEFPLPPPTEVNTQPEDDQNCVLCHTDEATLKAFATEEERAGEALSEGEGAGGSLPPLEAWEKVLLNEASFFETVHGRYGCVTCHGGVGGAGGKEAAHEGLVRDPTSAEACSDCHPDQVASEADSLHYTLAGYTAVLEARSSPEKAAQLEVMMGNHCATCHATCGQCHVSRPTNLGGGLVEGHLFQGIPPMDLTCNGCHGSRIENEYKGNNEGAEADVHWLQGGMSCLECHSADEMHGTLGESEYRYAGPPTPSCQDANCHPSVAAGDGIQQHTEFHFEAISCQVCHSTTYKNCFSCHVGLENGTAYYKMDPSEMMFKIGRNPLQSDDRPWTYVPVRHVPIESDSFDYYGQDLLPDFNALPTWKYATPHNIQRITPQNETCGSCHGNADLFLTVDDVAPDELQANEDVIVEEVPFPMP